MLSWKVCASNLHSLTNSKFVNEKEKVIKNDRFEDNIQYISLQETISFPSETSARGLEKEVKETRWGKNIGILTVFCIYTIGPFNW